MFMRKKYARLKPKLPTLNRQIIIYPFLTKKMLFTYFRFLVVKDWVTPKAMAIVSVAKIGSFVVTAFNKI